MGNSYTYEIIEVEGENRDLQKQISGMQRGYLEKLRDKLIEAGIKRWEALKV